MREWIKTIGGDVRSTLVGTVTLALLGALAGLALAVWNSVKERPFQWNFSIGICVSAVAISMVALIILVIHKRKASRIGREQTGANRFNLEVGPNFTSDNIWPIGPVRFLHAEVRIQSGTVHGCRAYLTAIKGEMKEWTGNEQLTFSPSEATDSLSKAIYANVPYLLDVLTVTSAGDVVVCNQSRQWLRLPRLRDLFAARGSYDLTLVIAGEDATAETFRFRFDWTGNWQTSFLHPVKPESALDALKQAQHNPLILALEDLDAIHLDGESKATLYQCEGAKLPTMEEAVAWNERAIASAKREIFAKHISTQDWAAFKDNWNFASCQKMARVLHEHGFLDDVNDVKSAHFKYLWGRVKRLGELIAKIKGLPADENKTPIESLTDFLLEAHSLLDVYCNLKRTLPHAEQNDLINRIRLFLRKVTPDYVPRFNEIIQNPPARALDFPEDFTEDDKKEWSRTRGQHCDRLHAIASHLSRIISDLRSKLPS